MARVSQEVDDFGRLALGFFLARHISERHLRALGIMLSRLAAPKSEDILLTAGHLPAEEDQEAEEQQEWQETEEQSRPKRATRGFTLDHHALRGKQVDQLLIVACTIGGIVAFSVSVEVVELLSSDDSTMR